MKTCVGGWKTTLIITIWNVRKIPPKPLPSRSKKSRLWEEHTSLNFPGSAGPLVSNLLTRWDWKCGYL